MSKRVTIAAAMILLLAEMPKSGRSEDAPWTWTSPKYVPCEGIGVAGTYKVYAVPTIDTARGVLQAFYVYAESAAFSKGSASISATITIMDKNQHAIETITLAPPGSNALVRKPGPTETEGRFLPKGKKPPLPSGGKVIVEVSPIILTDNGTCVLGKSSQDFPY